MDDWDRPGQTEYCVRVSGKQAWYHTTPLIEALHEQIREQWRRYRVQRRVLRKLGPGSTVGYETWLPYAVAARGSLRALFAIRRAGRQR